MTNVSIISSGPPVKSSILINVDNETVFGDGSIENPLRAEGASPITAENIDVEDTGVGGIADPALTVTFVTYTGAEPEGSTPVTIALADGTSDGQRKQVAFQASTNIQWILEPANLNGGSSIEFNDSSVAGAELTWDADEAQWAVSALLDGTVVGG